MKRILLTPLMLCGLASLAGPVAAAPEPVAPAAASEQLRVVRDAETGELRMPNAAELATMNKQEAAAKRSPAPAARAVRYSNGMKSVTLGEEHLVQVHGQRDADGKLSTSHDEPAMAHPAPAAPTE